MRRIKHLFLVLPMVLNAQLLNEPLLVENYYRHEVHISQDGRLALAYERLWDHGSGGSEPIIDSTHIYLTLLDSMANPIGENWSLRDDSTVQHMDPHIISNGNNLLWFYTEATRERRKIVSQSSSAPNFPEGDEYAFVDSIEWQCDPGAIELLNGQYLSYWIEWRNGASPLIWGQVLTETNHPAGDRFQLFTVDSTFFVGFYGDKKIHSATNSIASSTYLAWVEWIFDTSSQPIGIRSELYVMRILEDGTPMGEPHIVRSFSGEMSLNNLFIRDDGKLVLTYSTQTEFYNQVLWLHSVSDAGELSELSIITQLPEFSNYHTLYFPTSGPGVSINLSENKDSLKVQRLNPNGEIIGTLEVLPFDTHSLYPSIEGFLTDQKLIIFESSIYNALYAHVFAFNNFAAIEPSVSPLPSTPTLAAGYPNPFNPSTILKFTLPHQAEVSIKIYDVLGHQVENLIQSKMSAGIHKISWDASDQAAGIYFCRMETQQFSQVRKLILLK